MENKQRYSDMFPKVRTEQTAKFCFWIDEVEDIVYKKTGFSLLDLDDEMYMENFENGTTVKEMVDIVIDHFEKWSNIVLNW